MLTAILTIINNWLVSFQTKLTLLIRGRINGDSFYGGEVVILYGFPRRIREVLKDKILLYLNVRHFDLTHGNET